MIMHLSRTHIPRSKQIAYTLYFLAVWYVIIAFECELLPAVFLYCSFPLFIKRDDNAIDWRICYCLLYCLPFFKKSLSGLYCQRLLFSSFAPELFSICLTLSMLIDSTTFVSIRCFPNLGRVQVVKT